MTQPLPDAELPQRAEIFRQLAAHAPAERAALLLRLIAGAADGRLRLAACDGQRAMLDEIDFGSEAYQGGNAGNAASGNAASGGIDLRRAELHGATFRRANLRGAMLEEADLADADLAGARLDGANLAGANLAGAMLEEANLTDASLRFARLGGAVLEGARIAGADLWGASCAGADLNGVDFQGANLEEANLEGADLRGADLRGAILERANLRGANLQGANLEAAVLGHADLTGAILRDARLLEVDLSQSLLAGAHLGDAWLERTRLRRGQLGDAIGEELAGEYELARRGYLALERNFNTLGDSDAASWAYRKKRRMQKHDHRTDAVATWRRGRWASAARHFLKYANLQAVEWVCDYGESVPRVLASMFAIYLGFALLYGLTGSVVRISETPDGVQRVVTRDPLDLAIFSLLSMTTLGTPAVVLQPRNEVVHMLTGAEALLTIFLTGLLGFVAGNRIRR